MAIETSPAHLAYTTDGAAPRPVAAGAAGLACLVAVVVGLTLAHVHHVVSTAGIAASPAALREGRLWLLVTSGLLVQPPIALSLLSFAALGCLTLVVCGPRALWMAAVLGHVLSTVAVYAGLSVLRLAEPGIAQSVQSTPDYGVSAIAAAWLGAVALVAWRRQGSSLRGKVLVVLGCVGIALFAWWSKGHLNILDSEHAVAFAIGVLAARSRWGVTPVSGRELSAAIPPHSA